MTSPRGNVAGATAAAFTTTFSYDALSRTVSVVEPITATTSRTTSYGYDLAGNTSRVTDGRGNATVYVFNAWNVQTSVVEPSTSAHPNAVDRTWTSSLDAAGLPVKTVAPGGVTVTRTFDELGRLTVESGAGTGVVSASRTFGYDAAGLRTSVGTVGGNIVFSYDDRGLLLSTSGPVGFAGSSFVYDSVGRVVSRSDAAGTVTASYNSRNLPVSVVDPLTGQTVTYTWDAAGQLTKVAYSGGGARTLAYDDLGRVTADRLSTSAGSVTAGFTVGYDADSNVTARTVTLPGNTGAGASTYGYDNAGRLTSWTKPGGASVAYGYDASGNLVNNAGVVQSFDQRNRMLTSGSNTYTWTARGTLATQKAGTAAPVAVTFDGLDRQTGQGAQGYVYDSLDRIVTQGSTGFAYAGAEIDPVRVGTSVLSRTPGGQLLATKTGTCAATLAGLDNHGDVFALYSGAGVVVGSRTYTPLGQPVATGGSYAAPVGFQADYTDPSTADVWMGARWYRPGTGTFTARDTVFGKLDTPVSLNRYTYAWADPLGMWDPDGREPHAPGGDVRCEHLVNAPGCAAGRRNGGGGSHGSTAGRWRVPSGTSRDAGIPPVGSLPSGAFVAPVLVGAPPAVVATPFVAAGAAGVALGCVIADCGNAWHVWNEARQSQSNLAHSKQHIQEMVNEGTIPPGVYGGDMYNVQLVAADGTVYEPNAVKGTVVGNALSPAEVAQAGVVVGYRGGDFVGVLKRNEPGIDGTLDGVPVSLKSYSGDKPLGVLTAATKSERQLKNAGYTQVELYVSAPNVSREVLEDFAGKGPLAKIPYQGTISTVYVRTKDGWVVLGG